MTDIRFGSVMRGVVFLGFVVATGTLWFSMNPEYTVLEALYMTVITISTVGFREVHDLTPYDQAFLVMLIIGGLTVITYTLSSVGHLIIEGSIQRYVGRQKMLREIDKLKNHYIICGHGRMGQILCEELRREGVPFVVIEGDHEGADRLGEMHHLVVEGDATEDEVLRKAGINRAKGLVAVVSSNVDNLYITLSAREMCRQENPDLYILARATDKAAGQKISRAGANRVISPYAIGGMRIVQALLRPTVYDFVEITTQGSGLSLKFEELTVGPNSRLDGVALKDSSIREEFNVIVIAVKKPSGEMVFNPGPDVSLQAADVVITLGDKEQIGRLAGALR